tara:strand:+ start:455 stop:1879 length:1425 start_codon:yes stop_codon:yes gene_type:complete
LGNEGGFSFGFPRDFTILAVSQFVEAIILYDKILVPQVPHVFGSRLTNLFREFVEPVEINIREYYEAEKKAVDWISVIDFSEALKICRLSLNSRPHGSDTYALSALFGVKKPGLDAKDSTPFPLRFSIPWRNIGPLLDLSMSSLIDQKSKAVTEINDELEKLAEEVDLSKAMADHDEFGGGNSAKSVAFYTYWLLHRARTYETVCRRLGTPYMPHPARSLPCAVSAAGDQLELEGRSSLALGHYADAITGILDEGRDAASKIGLQLPVVRLPPLFQYVLGRIDRKDQLLDEAENVRNTKKAERLRSHLREVEEAVRDGNIGVATRAAKRTERLKDAFRSELGLLVENQEVRVGFMGIGTKFNLPKGHLKKFSRAASSADLLLVRDIFAELSSVSRLGAKYEMLAWSDGRPVDPSVDVATDREIIEHLKFVFARSSDLVEKRYEIYRLIRTVNPDLPPGNALKILRKAIDELEER